MSKPERTLLDRIFYVWRILATGFSFTIFYLTGLLASLTAFPLLRAISSDETDRHARAQRFNQLWFKTFAGLMKTVGVVRDIKVTFEVDPREDGPYILLANHPTLIDVVAVVSELERIDCVVKMDVWNSLAMGGPVRTAGYIPDRSALHVYETCRERLEAGRSVLFFPEGTRSPKGGLREFSKVAAQVALSSDASILPVVIETNVSTLRRDQNWYDVPEDPLEMNLTFHEPVGFIASEYDSMSEGSTVVTDRIKGFFEEKLGYS